MTQHIPFQNSYARLPAAFFTHVAPEPVPAPALLALNDGLARDLGIDPQWLASPEGVAVLAGNAVATGSEPLAQVYAAHQFGGWVARLGDGRAVLLGEVASKAGLRDLVLKGSGRTAYSRNGDGRAWLGPVLREYLVSEWMHSVGVPTTRALAAVSTGARVQREQAYPGAILVRVASSHLRIGTFQYFAARGDFDSLEVLTDFALARHFPQAKGPLGLVISVVQAQAELIAKWMGLGFVHGVMNTDNMTISGETIDYGPCAFIDTYHPDAVYSSIDTQGRYAYSNQANVAGWNLAQLASSLVGIMAKTEEEAETAIAALTEVINSFAARYHLAWEHVFAAKLGIAQPKAGDKALAKELLDLMAAGQADFTNTFYALGAGGARDQFSDPAAFDLWEAKWRARIAQEADPLAVMRAANPAVIPRTHRIEQAIQAAVGGDMAPFERLRVAFETPFALSSDNRALAFPPTEDEVVARTFCGT
ncbi:hypothetical protein AQS8620_01912 [Aquimixticola soesokkakensis]|uniref:Protein nucleotidyltransferase YdiU n=1 Tax=Aquimixticola soesokkakensis TaxID=1519096 RepID=A0A1Y5SW13_9RHOB|nr:YdiU family protein [Aquimixticola soesokkakensis]SLN46331.1 hypothetical protein AQS8620_01912 [Aquimixticola soesokkakensis]